MVKSKPSGPQKEWFVGCLPGPRGMLWASPWKNLRHHVTLRLCCHCCKSLHQYYLCRSHIYVLCVLSRSVMSDSLWPHGLDSPWNSPGQNTGVGSLSLLQGIFPTQGSNLCPPHCRRILYQLSHQRSPFSKRNKGSLSVQVTTETLLVAQDKTRTCKQKFEFWETASMSLTAPGADDFWWYWQMGLLDLNDTRAAWLHTNIFRDAANIRGQERRSKCRTHRRVWCHWNTISMVSYSTLQLSFQKLPLFEH